MIIGVCSSQPSAPPAYNPLAFPWAAFYDPSDLSNLHQDTGQSVAVAVGDPVGAVADQSTHGTHLFQSTAGSRPVLDTNAGGYKRLHFDTIDDVMATLVGLNMGTTQKATIFLAHEMIGSLSSAQGIFSCGGSFSENGAFYVYTYTGGFRYAGLRGSSDNDEGGTTAGGTGPAILTLRLDLSAGLTREQALRMEVNGTPVSLNYLNGAPGAANIVNGILRVGQLFSGFGRAEMGLYHLSVLPDDMADADRAAHVAWINDRCGAF